MYRRRLKQPPLFQPSTPVLAAATTIGAAVFPVDPTTAADAVAVPSPPSPPMTANVKAVPGDGRTQCPFHNAGYFCTATNFRPRLSRCLTTSSVKSMGLSDIRDRAVFAIVQDQRFAVGVGKALQRCPRPDPVLHG